MSGTQAFANEADPNKPVVEAGTEVESKETPVETVQVGDEILEIVNLEELTTPLFTADSVTGMYTVGKTADGRVIQASAVSDQFSRAAGNVHGEIISIVIGGVLYEGVKITIDGKGALCIDQNLRAPFEANVPYDNGAPYENVGVKAILANGAYGPLNPNPTDEEIILTEIAMRNWLTGKTTPSEAVSNSHPYVANLIAKAEAGDYFDKKISLSSNSVTSDIVGKEQVSKTITITGDADNYVSIPVPQGVTLTNLSTGEKVTNGTAKVHGGQQFNMSASLAYNQKYQSGTLQSAFGAYAALMFTPFDAGYQRLMQGKFTDPISIPGFEVDFFARQGKFKLKKTSDISNLPMGNVGFVVNMSTGERLEMETNASGETPESKDFDFGVTGEVTEVKTPAGYVALENPIPFAIEAGETIEIAVVNKIQMGFVEGQKFEEVYEAEPTWVEGKPIYARNPAANREFDIVRLNDHTLPDFQTVIGKTGEIADHVKTDENGNFKSNVELFIGEQNKYKLVETNVPDNYRDPSDVQTEFAIPYGNNTEKLVLFDQGEIDNMLKTTNVTFNKKNPIDLTGLNLAGAQFLVQGLTNDVKFMFTTENTSTLLKLLADKGTATYMFTEVKRPDGFGPVPGETDTRIVTVTDGQDLTIDWENMPLVTEKPKVGISTRAHTGDGKTNTFVWGEEATFYDDSKLTHENIPNGTNRFYETKLFANYKNAEGKVITEMVWTSGKIGYTVTDKEMTEQVIAEYDYRKDPKADKNTEWFFAEDGFNEEGEKDTEHNPDGKDPEQMLRPVVKPTTPTTPNKSTGSFPNTGEQAGIAGMVIGSMMIVTLLGYVVLDARKKAAAEKE